MVRKYIAVLYLKLFLLGILCLILGFDASALEAGKTGTSEDVLDANLPLEIKNNKCIKNPQLQIDGTWSYDIIEPPESLHPCKKYDRYSCDPTTGKHVIRHLDARDAPKKFKNPCIEQSSLKCEDEWEFEYTQRHSGWELTDEGECEAIKCKNGEDLISVTCQADEEGNVICLDKLGNPVKISLPYLSPVYKIAARGASLYLAMDNGEIIKGDFKTKELSYFVSGKRFFNSKDLKVDKDDNLLILHQDFLYQISSASNNQKIALKLNNENQRIATIDDKTYLIKDETIVDSNAESTFGDNVIYICPEEKFEFVEEKVISGQ